MPVIDTVNQSMLSRIYNFLRGPHPLHPAVLKNRVQPRAFRRLRPADHSQCVELYRLNEPGRFPKGCLGEYEKALAHEKSYKLVTEENGRVIATGGISFQFQPNLVVLSFGMVHPEYHGKGIGTLLLLARLALLKPARNQYHVFVFCVDTSFSFYRRFGFSQVQPWRDPHGDAHPTGYLRLEGVEIGRCRKLLEGRGITVPAHEEEIPLCVADKTA